MSGHEMNLIVQSHDGGRTWSSVPMADGMHQSGGTGFLFFIDTGHAETTAKTWLWTAQGTIAGLRPSLARRAGSVSRPRRTW
jgi:hypothetical protein